MLCLGILVGTLFFGAYDDGQDSFSYVDALYLSVMTITTVGYGDLSPQNRSMRLFTVFYILFGVALFANCIQVLATVYPNPNPNASRCSQQSTLTLMHPGARNSLRQE